LWLLCLQCFKAYSGKFYGSFWTNLLPRNEIVSSTPNAKDNLLEKFNDNLYDIKIIINFSVSQKKKVLILYFVDRASCYDSW
jgi:hypothetical protein